MADSFFKSEEKRLEGLKSDEILKFLSKERDLTENVLSSKERRDKDKNDSDI